MATNQTGKVVLVTGASRGIGRALARGFAGDGDNVVAFARSEKDLQEIISGDPERFLAVAGDVTSERQPFNFPSANACARMCACTRARDPAKALHKITESADEGLRAGVAGGEASGRQPLPEHLPRETVQHSAACVCPSCGGTVLTRIRM